MLVSTNYSLDGRATGNLLQVRSSARTELFAYLLLRLHRPTLTLTTSYVTYHTFMNVGPHLYECRPIAIKCFSLHFSIVLFNVSNKREFLNLINRKLYNLKHIWIIISPVMVFLLLIACVK